MSFSNRRTPPIRYLLLLLVTLGITLALSPLSLIRHRTPASMVPIPQTDAWWIAQHEHALARVGQGNIDLVMIGDSITQGWGNEGRRIWDTYYGHRHAVNLGFNGDRTEHVLWRLDHGEIDGIHPKLVVVMIGTNNTGGHHDPSEETAAGIHAILTTLRTRLPAAKILLLGLFPRTASADDPIRRINEAVNDHLRAYADNQHIFFLDLSRHFLDVRGHLSHDLMPDFLHPNEHGYRVWADGMEDIVGKLLDE
ncbi:MAG: GDSL-type esterase/lipase family protein [Nitrospiraceae bacterium]